VSDIYLRLLELWRTSQLSVLGTFGLLGWKGRVKRVERTIDKVATGSVEDKIAPMIIQSRKEKSYFEPRAFTAPNRNPPIPNAARNVPMIAYMSIEPILRNNDCRCTEKPLSKMMKGRRTRKKVSLLNDNPFESPGSLYQITAIIMLRVTVFHPKAG